jgi:hypothetical protein
VQGRLRNERLAIEIETECGCCGRELRIDSVYDGNSLRNEVRSEGAEPLVFEPQIDWARFTEPSIIHAY